MLREDIVRIEWCNLPYAIIFVLSVNLNNYISIRRVDLKEN